MIIYKMFLSIEILQIIILLSSQSRVDLSMENLEPFHSNGDHCEEQITCLGCLLDLSCGWCQLSSTCHNKTDVETACHDNAMRLTVEFGECSKCSEYVSCADCVQVGFLYEPPSR